MEQKTLLSSMKHCKTIKKSRFQFFSSDLLQTATKMSVPMKTMIHVKVLATDPQGYHCQQGPTPSWSHINHSPTLFCCESILTIGHTSQLEQTSSTNKNKHDTAVHSSHLKRWMSWRHSMISEMLRCLSKWCTEQWHYVSHRLELGSRVASPNSIWELTTAWVFHGAIFSP